jgi:hypothetical protein
MKTAFTWLLISGILGVTSWLSAAIGYRVAIARLLNNSPAIPTPAQEIWQYQTYDLGNKADMPGVDEKIAQVVNFYGAEDFEPCSPPEGIFPPGTESSNHLMWFRRHANPFSRSITKFADNTVKAAVN